jgi:[acyl-carrier-protein] S-malonyltransferase
VQERVRYHQKAVPAGLATMAAMGVEKIIEIGPKRAVCGLIKRINKNIELFSVEDVNSLHKTAELFST